MTSSELPPAVDGTVNQSFCFTSITERWPKILAKLVDQLHQYFSKAVETYGESGGTDTKEAIGKLSELRYLISTDKALQHIAEAPDAAIWNGRIDQLRKELGESNTTWFKIPWLFSECLMYRKIAEIFSATTHLRTYDYFQAEKQQSFLNSIAHVTSIAHELASLTSNSSFQQQEMHNVLLRLLQIELWGNKCDLSFSGSEQHCLSATIFQEFTELRKKILVDNLDEACNFILNKCGTQIDIVLDNAGLEVYTDICLADFLISKSLTKRVVFHGKAMPWYVSDTTREDFDWTIDQVKNSDDPVLSQFGSRWAQYVVDGLFVFNAHPFWTYGFAYFEMEEQSPDLYEELSASDFIIFKGDLNYRKLVGDRHWPLKTPFKTALRGFEPTPLLSLRTLKAETVAGLSDSAITLLEKNFGPNDTSWMFSGEYAVAQFHHPSH